MEEITRCELIVIEQDTQWTNVTKSMVSHLDTSRTMSIVLLQWRNLVKMMRHNLLARNKLCSHQIPITTIPSTTSVLKITVQKVKVKIQDLSSLKMIGVADIKERLYAMRNNVKAITKPHITHSVKSRNRISSFVCYDSNNWHLRLGHLSHEKLTVMKKNYHAIRCNKTDLPCHICHLAKQKRLPYSNSVSRSANVFDIVHIDIWSPMSMPSTSGHRYFLTVVDDKSRFTWLYFMKAKSEVPDLVRNFTAMISTQFGSKIKCIRSDNGREFYINDFYVENGIEHQTSCVETPQQNDIVERNHQHILGVARSLIFQSELPHYLWDYDISHAILLINKQPTKYLSYKSPYAVLYNNQPNISNLRVFGCLCYASILTSHRRKLDHRARRCNFLGLKSGVKGCIVIDISTHEIFISRNTAFYEQIFPYKNIMKNQSYAENNYPPRPIVDKIYDFTTIEQKDNQDMTRLNSDPNSAYEISDQNQILDSDSNFHDDESHTNASSYNSHHPYQEQTSLFAPRHSLRKKYRPSYLQDYHCSMMIYADNAKTNDNALIKYPLSKSMSYERLSHNHRHYSMSIYFDIEPTHYEEAIKSECWRDAIRKELTALNDNKTWIIFHLPSNKRAIGCKWVFKTKHKSDGSIERHKARLVAKGFTQTEGVDFLETFSPVIKMTTIRVIFALAFAYNWHLHQLDINTAFLHGDLKEEVYMKIPLGVHVKNPKLVCKLQKSIYGLKQASRQWHDKLTGILIQSGYTKSIADYSLFTKSSNTNFTAILVYVDDLILTGNCMTEIDYMKCLLNDKFSIKYLGQLKFFLGMEIARTTK
ncbi:putative RNA-directed DNA polymerase [Lupinus albus]|uniref:Putative RNA-directed DNA polymerase n=1 Tax=Lupinus albus TaxID=3870 RepID=A0A6A4NL03_LUPAL|nr:putative RNA-directed DNA polymerase [Lupinus albus]